MAHDISNAAFALPESLAKRAAQERLFNQFPARIYVQGKFTPEARLADAVAAAKQRKEIA